MRGGASSRRQRPARSGWWLAALGLLAGMGLAPPGRAAAPLSAAQSLVGVACYDAIGGNDNGSAGPLPVGLSLQCDWSDSAPQGRWGTASWQAAASAHTGLAGLGVVDGVAHASATNLKSRADASAGGWVRFVWRLDALADAPFAPDAVPLSFTAVGEGHLSGDGPFYGGRIQASVSLALQGFPSARYALDSGETYQFGAVDRQFGGTVTLDAQPGMVVSGLVHANCWVVTMGSAIDGDPPTPLSSHAECNVAADPVLALDQAAFDARYGAAAFTLADYYQLSVSPNVPVPEPGTSALWLLGLSGLAAAGRRGRRAALFTRRT